jgi:hypothetical protein
MRLTDHVTLNFNNNMSTAAILLDIEEAFGTTWHLGLLYKLSKLKILISLIKLINFFFLRKNWKSRSKVKCLRQGIYKQGCHKVPSCPHILQYIYDTPQIPGVYLGPFADDTCIHIYVTDRAKKVMFSESCSEVSVLLRCGVSAGT